jgi:hypothetical protein
MKTLLITALMSAMAFAGVTRERRPEIYLEYGSRDGAVTKVTFLVDGRDVTEQAVIGPNRASYKPAADLAIGEHAVEITVSDDKGRTRTKKWSFTVDPNAKDAEPPVVEFLAPTPGNGEVRVPSRMTALVRVTDAVAGVESVKLALGPHGGAMKELKAARSGDVWQAELGELAEGTYLLKAVATDRDGNRAPEMWRGFAVDGAAPKVVRISLAPDPVTLPGPATILVEVDDKPFGEVREVVVEVAGRKLTGPVVRRLAAIEWDLKDGHGRYVAAGKVPAVARAVDFGGLSGEAKAELVVRGEAPAEGDIPLRLDPPKPVAATSPIAITGGTKPGAEVELFVNGRPAGTTTGGGSGGFTFERVELEAGLNRITGIARDVKSGESSAAVVVTTTWKRAETAQGGVASPETPPTTGGTAIDVPLSIDPPAPTTEGGTTTITLTTRPGASVEVTVNGRAGPTRTADGQGRAIVLQVPLEEGLNRVTVRARSGGSTSAPASVEITRRKPAKSGGEEPAHRP